VTWLDDLAAQAHANLTDEIREALYGRGVSDEQMAAYRIGYLDRRLPDLQGADDFLAWAHQGERLDDVFAFPLTTTLGVIQGFQFRHVDRARKGYLDFIPYKEEAVLFGLGQAMPQAWATKTLWLVEGVFDLLPLQRHIPNIVATLTARVPENLVRVMRRMVDRVWVGYDMDAAGRAAAAAFSKAHQRDFQVQTVYYPTVRALGSTQPVKDPGDLWEAWGDERVGHFLQTLVHPLETP
jgi:DNA primase